MVPGDLRDKYVRMKELRENHARARRDAAWAEPDPRPAMARLAAQFPGALREIDRLPMRVIDARVAALDAVMQGAPVAPWMEAQMLFHSRARDVLAAKRWLGGAKSLTEEKRAAFAAAHPGITLGGRLVPAVLRWVATQLAIPEERAHALVFGFEE